MLTGPFANSLLPQSVRRLFGGPRCRLQVAALRENMLDPARPLLAGGEIRHAHSAEAKLLSATAMVGATLTGARRARRGHRPAANSNRGRIAS